VTKFLREIGIKGFGIPLEPDLGVQDMLEPAIATTNKRSETTPFDSGTSEGLQ
jgi:hypothetical protein